MDRREVIRKLFFSGNKNKNLLPDDLSTKASSDSIDGNTPHRYISQWQQLPDSTSLSEDIGSPYSSGWCIKNGELHCVCHSIERTLIIRTYRLVETSKVFKAVTILRFFDNRIDKAWKENYAGFRIGVKVDLYEYDPAITTENGIDIGITRDGCLFIGDNFSSKQIAEEILLTEIRLVLSAIPQTGGKYFTKLKALDRSGNTLATLSDEQEAATWMGFVGLVSQSQPESYNTDESSVSFRYLEVEGRGWINIIEKEHKTIH